MTRRSGSIEAPMPPLQRFPGIRAGAGTDSLYSFRGHRRIVRSRNRPTVSGCSGQRRNVFGRILPPVFKRDSERWQTVMCSDPITGIRGVVVLSCRQELPTDRRPMLIDRASDGDADGTVEGCTARKTDVRSEHDQTVEVQLTGQIPRNASLGFEPVEGDSKAGTARTTA
jgi:hypothetical protein